jgi:hypothetical protein
MDRIDTQIRSELRRFGPADGDITAIVRVWPTAVGPTVARNAWPARLARDGTLHVHTASSTWAFELGKLAPAILDRLRAELRASPPPALRFVPGPIPEPVAEAPDQEVAGRPEIGAEHRAEAARIAAGIEDEELREYVARAAAASLAGTAAETLSDRDF